MKKYFLILFFVLLLNPIMAYAYIDPSSNTLFYQYIGGVLIVNIIFGIATRAISRSKGYDGGFAWGFFLGIIGIIVVACKANINNTSNYQSSNQTRNDSYISRTESCTSELERLAKLHDSGALSDAEFNDAKQRLLAKM